MRGAVRKNKFTETLWAFLDFAGRSGLKSRHGQAHPGPNRLSQENPGKQDQGSASQPNRFG